MLNFKNQLLKVYIQLHSFNGRKSQNIDDLISVRMNQSKLFDMSLAQPPPHGAPSALTLRRGPHHLPHSPFELQAEGWSSATAATFLQASFGIMAPQRSPQHLYRPLNRRFPPTFFRLQAELRSSVIATAYL